MTYSFAASLRTQASKIGDRVAVRSGESTRTYSELLTSSARVGQALIADGVVPGDRVAYIGRNRVEYPEVMCGVSMARAALVGVNWRLSVSEMTHVLNDSAPRVAIVDSEFVHVAAEACAAAGIKRIVVIGADGDGGTGDGGTGDGVIGDGVIGDGVTDYAGWAAAQEAVDPGLEPQPDDIAILMYTSGTTGRPKGVILPNSSIGANLALPTPWTWGPGSVVLVVSPVFHTAGTGWTYLGLDRGAEVVLVGDPTPAEILRCIAEHRVTHALLVPALIYMLLQSPALATSDLSSMVMVVYGASPITTSVLEGALKVFGCDFVQAYGMTETGGPVTYLLPADHVRGLNDPALLRSAGRPIDGIEVGVFDPHAVAPSSADRLRDGDVGEVWTRSKQNTPGYWRNHDASALLTTPDGWLRTGDAGYIETGYLYLTDRINDMIISGGENVYPAEVENVLASHPLVSEAAVVASPHPQWGETVKAFLVVHRGQGSELDPAEVIAFCRDRLAHYKCPTLIEVVEELPRNPAGKVLRRLLRDRPA